MRQHVSYLHLGCVDRGNREGGDWGAGMVELSLPLLLPGGTGDIGGNPKAKRIARSHRIRRASTARRTRHRRIIIHRGKVDKVAAGGEEAAANTISERGEGRTGKHAGMTTVVGGRRHRQGRREGRSGARGGQVVAGHGGADDAAVDGRRHGGGRGTGRGRREGWGEGGISVTVAEAVSVPGGGHDHGVVGGGGGIHRHWQWRRCSLDIVVEGGGSSSRSGGGGNGRQGRQIGRCVQGGRAEEVVGIGIGTGADADEGGRREWLVILCHCIVGSSWGRRRGLVAAAAGTADDLASPRGRVEGGPRGESAVQQKLLVAVGIGSTRIFDVHLSRRSSGAGSARCTQRYGRYGGHVDVQGRRRGKGRRLR